MGQPLSDARYNELLARIALIPTTSPTPPPSPTLLVGTYTSAATVLQAVAISTADTAIAAIANNAALTAVGLVSAILGEAPLRSYMPENCQDLLVW